MTSVAQCKLTSSLTADRLGDQHPCLLSRCLNCCVYLRQLSRLVVGLSPALSAAVGVEQRRTATQEQTHTVLSDSLATVRKIPGQAEAGGDGEAPQIHGRSLESASRSPVARHCSSTVRLHRRLTGTSCCFLPIAGSE